ncbi:PEP-CTERM sorting domain-containing protein [candidate division GN15 bacterium]|nr:PEP-CTERM sorting domain-containing protein [candidate division GN15 bacterium]
MYPAPIEPVQRIELSLRHLAIQEFPMIKLATITLTGLLLLAVSATALPTLTANGMEVSAMSGPSEDLTFSFSRGQQTWTMLNETTPWRDLNYLGVYDDIGTGLNQTQVFGGPDPVGHSVTTNFAAGQELGMYLLNDLNNNQVFDGDDSYLFSERSLTQYSWAMDHQWFSMYDVSSFGESDFFFNTTTQDIRLSGRFDYLIFIDDDHTAANWDHNDMVVGVSAVPEPTTMLLFGLGLAGAGIVRRRRK